MFNKKHKSTLIISYSYNTNKYIKGLLHQVLLIQCTGNRARLFKLAFPEILGNSYVYKKIIHFDVSKITLFILEKWYVLL